MQVNAHDLAPAEKNDEILTYTSSPGETTLLYLRLKRSVSRKTEESWSVELSVTAYRGERGELIGVATTERDVTQRKLDRCLFSMKLRSDRKPF